MKNNWPDNVTIQQYLQGTLDKELMHELEKRALDDPFLSDALEGYHLIPDPGHDLSILQRQLQKRIMLQQENKKVFDLSWQRLSVAAAAAVMFISAGVLFWMNSQLPDKQLAFSPKKTEAAIVPADTLKGEAGVHHTETLTRREAIAIKSPPMKPRIKIDKPLFADKTPTANNDTLKSRIAIIADRKDRISAAESVYLEHKKESLTGGDSTAAFLPEQKLAESALSRFSDSPASRNAGDSEMTRSGFASSASAVPVNGWLNYRRYLQENIAKAASVIDQKGKVMVGFTVNQRSELSGFKILQSLSPLADSLAVKLIKAGPKWKAAADGRVSNLEVELEF